ncbi:glycan metabolism protein [Flavobacterium sp. KMS]|uniref:RagB/SusD family nutrient uptake outer membrane protein n=1 Tax=Flavobacterium sp. KMS TaxID=1566023 RepID=UPI00057D3025|nr:RagB/SusD family nutrient uptake outer membrane protein [Flavobacterium sp. KMS]KIA99888.1 glycan metabolism protein [Flavobacterium sp. KMS]
MKKILTITLSLLMLTSCDKEFLNTTPESTINDEQLATSEEGYAAIINGVYSALRSYGLSIGANHEDYGHKSILAATDIMSNDVVQTKSSWYGSFYNYIGRQQTSIRSKLAWSTYYPQIKTLNIVLNAVPAEAATTEKLKNIRGEALALRGYLYFMLARMYGPTYVGHQTDLCVPIYTTVSLEPHARSTVNEVYTLIENDLKESLPLLKTYTRRNTSAVNLSVAQAFLADIYLEMGKYAEAATLAHTSRQGYPLLSEGEWNTGFYDVSNKDTMWGIALTSAQSSFVASFFGHFDNTNGSAYAGGGEIYKNIDKRLYDAIPDTDYRKKAFVAPTGNATYPKLPAYANIKFRDPTVNGGDYIYLRAAAMYYIEAEAYAKSGNEAQAIQTLYDITVTRDPSYVKSTNTGAALINEIILQKRIELWGEGFAWFDMKRLGIPLVRDYAESNHATFGKFNIPAGDNKFTFQVPQAEIDANTLIVQSPL